MTFGADTLADASRPGVVLRGSPKLNDAAGDPALHVTHCRLFQEAREPKAAVALHLTNYNFVRIHSTLRISPAMEAGITDHLWTWEELLAT